LLPLWLRPGPCNRLEIFRRIQERAVAHQFRLTVQAVCQRREVGLIVGLMGASCVSKFAFKASPHISPNSRLKRTGRSANYLV